MIKLSACHDKGCVNGYVYYNPEEKGFDTIPDVKSDISLLVAYVQIGFNSDDMCSNQIFGLAPSNSWDEDNFNVPTQMVKCALKLDEDFDYGTWRLDRENEWRYYHNPKSGWFCVGDPRAKAETNVNFIDNAIASLSSKGELLALWIKPIFK